MTVFAAAFQAACALAALARYSPIASEAGLPLSKNPHFNVDCWLFGEILLAVMVPRAQHDTWRPATREAALTYLAAAAYLTPFMFGLPVHLVLWRLGWGKLRTYIVAGFLVGALTLPLFAIIPGSSFVFAYAKFSPVGFSAMMFFSGLTKPVAVTFWLIARPDRYRRATAGKAIPE